MRPPTLALALALAASPLFVGTAAAAADPLPDAPCMPWDCCGGGPVGCDVWTCARDPVDRCPLYDVSCDGPFVEACRAVAFAQRTAKDPYHACHAVNDREGPIVGACLDYEGVNDFCARAEAGTKRVERCVLFIGPPPASPAAEGPIVCVREPCGPPDCAPETLPCRAVRCLKSPTACDLFAIDCGGRLLDPCDVLDALRNPPGPVVCVTDPCPPHVPCDGKGRLLCMAVECTHDPLGDRCRHLLGERVPPLPA